MVTSSADAYSEALASCLICGEAASEAPDSDSGGSAISELAELRSRLPSPELCSTHWQDYQTDWLLLGWCVDHYGQALTHCPVHDREIDAL